MDCVNKRSRDFDGSFSEYDSDGVLISDSDGGSPDPEWSDVVLGTVAEEIMHVVCQTPAATTKGKR